MTGSHKAAWKNLGGRERVCDVCGRKLKVSEIQEQRVVYPRGVVEVRGECCRFDYTQDREGR